MCAMVCAQPCARKSWRKTWPHATCRSLLPPKYARLKNVFYRSVLEAGLICFVHSSKLPYFAAVRISSFVIQPFHCVRDMCLIRMSSLAGHGVIQSLLFTVMPLCVAFCTPGGVVSGSEITIPHHSSLKYIRGNQGHTAILHVRN